MRRVCLVAAVTIAFAGSWLTPKAFALATETKGNEPLSEKNYTEWQGIMPLVNDRVRVYETWANGAERLFYKGTTKELNAALANFAKVKVKNHVVVLRPGPAGQHSFDKTAIPYNWSLHVIGGIARTQANDNIEDLDWQKDPVLTIYVGGDIDLGKIEVPKGVTWRSAPGQSDEARKNEAALKMIAEFLELRNKTPGDLVKAVTARVGFPPESYPVLPSLSTEVKGRICNEFAKSASVRAAYEKLDVAKRRNVEWFEGVADLEKEQAVWCLQSCLCHPSQDVQIHALKSLERLKDTSAVPFLVLYAQYMAVHVEGSENATIHGVIHKSLAKTLSVLTGVEVTLKGQDEERLKKGVKSWRKWLVDQDETAQNSGGDPSAASERDPEKAFRMACELVVALEGKHDLLKGVSKVKPTIKRDEQRRLKSANLAFENNAVPPGKNDAKAKDDSKPYFYVSVQVWSGRSQSPPANLYEFAWQGQTYQMWMRVYSSDTELVKMVRKSVDEPLRGPLPPKLLLSGKWPGSRSSLQELAHGTAEDAGPWQSVEIVRFTDFDDLEVKLDGKVRQAFLVGLCPLREAVKDKHQQDRLRKDILSKLLKNALSARVITGRNGALGLSVDTFMHHKNDFDHGWDPNAYPYCWSGWGAYNLNTYFLFTKVTTYQDNLGNNTRYRELFERAVKKVKMKEQAPADSVKPGSVPRNPIAVSIIQLIATPDAFDGKSVRVHGFVRIEHEGIAVYLHRDDCEHMLTRNGIWLACNDVTPEGSREALVNNRYALIEGRFDAKSKGHLGLWSGSIDKITRMESWNIRKGAKKGEAEMLDGEWETMNVESEGKELGGGFHGFTMIIKGQTFEVVVAGEAKPVGGGTIKLDVGKEPPTIDMTYTGGAGKGTTRLGVYRLKGNTLRIALAETGASRPIEVGSKPGSGATLYEYRRKKVENDPLALTYKAEDVTLIANWLCGNDPGKAFATPFGDRKFLTDDKDSLLYTDIPGVKSPADIKAVNYEFAQARMQQIKRGCTASPAVLIVRSSLDNQDGGKKDLIQKKGEAGGRVYYVEVAIGNLAWHWLKVVVRDEGDKPNAKIIWHKKS